MSDKLTDMRNMRFLLYEVMKVEELLKYPYHEDHSRETFDMAIDTAYQLAREVFWPQYQAFDREGAQFDGKHVKAPQGMHEIWRQFKEGGWFSPNLPYDLGGQQFPLTIYGACFFVFNCANTSATMYVGASWGAAHLIRMFGCEALKAKYMMPLYSGEWGGTMVLTEPDAGTSLGDIKTTAVKAPDGDHYLIRGTKRFISGGDHDLTDNIIHPVLARLEGAPAGVKGISLFVVPKYRVNDDGTVGEFNDVNTAGIEHKMGLKGSATATLSFGENGDCRGWLIGEPNKGLKYMFELMNHARIFTAIQAVGVASSAYQNAVEYANERLQGRDVTSRDATEPQIPIVNHTDVRVMLLRQKAFVEGAMGLILYCARLADEEGLLQDPEQLEHNHLLLEVLTPCCKAYGSDGAFESIRNAVQCYGGAGFCEEYPVAQMLRDNKVFSIYEGANGIQALDLLGRKVPMQGGAAVRALMMEIAKTVEEGKALDGVKAIAEKVEALQNEVIGTTMHLAGLGMSGEISLYVANATAYLEMFAQLAVSWQLLKQAVAAQQALDAGTTEEAFYKSKIETTRFYANYVVPHALATASILKTNDRTALDFKPEWF